MSAEDLQALAWPVAEPWFRKEQEEAGVRYRQSIGTGLASNNLEEIVPAAHHGRVGYLFVEVGRRSGAPSTPRPARPPCTPEPKRAMKT